MARSRCSLLRIGWDPELPEWLLPSPAVRRTRPTEQGAAHRVRPADDDVVHIQSGLAEAAAGNSAESDARGAGRVGTRGRAAGVAGSAPGRIRLTIFTPRFHLGQLAPDFRWTTPEGALRVGAVPALWHVRPAMSPTRRRQARGGARLERGPLHRLDDRSTKESNLETGKQRSHTRGKRLAASRA